RQRHESRVRRRGIEDSFRIRPDETTGGQQTVDSGNERGEEEERPDRAVRAKEPELEKRGGDRDETSEEDPSRARVGCRARIGDHEEGEEEQAAVLETVDRNRERLAEGEGSRGEEHGIRAEEGESDVRPRRALDDEQAGAGDQKPEEGR